MAQYTWQHAQRFLFLPSSRDHPSPRQTRVGTSCRVSINYGDGERDGIGDVAGEGEGAGEAEAELADPSSSSEADSFESSAVLLSSSCPLWLALFEAEFMLLDGSEAEGWAGTDGTTGPAADRNGALKMSSSASSMGRSSSAISSCSSDDTMADNMLPVTSGGSGIMGMGLGAVVGAALGAAVLMAGGAAATVDGAAAVPATAVVSAACACASGCCAGLPGLEIGTGGPGRVFLAA
jgi:hypothetical protein